MWNFSAAVGEMEVDTLRDVGFGPSCVTEGRQQPVEQHVEHVMIREHFLWQLCEHDYRCIKHL